jgi:hypothetical protein
LYNNSSKCTRYSNSNNDNANNNDNIETITHTIETNSLTQYNHCDDNNIQSRDNDANMMDNSEKSEYVDEYIIEIQNSNKWHSTEAYSYFLNHSNYQFDSDHYSNQEKHLKDILRNQLTPLRNVWLNLNRWKEVVKDNQQPMSPKTIHHIHIYSKYLLYSLSTILNKYHHLTISKITAKVSSIIYQYESNPILFSDQPQTDKPISSLSIMKWLCSYFKSRNLSIVTTSDISNHPKNMPPIFLKNPELLTGF